jgi:hypothetical protein
VRERVAYHLVGTIGVDHLGRAMKRAAAFLLISLSELSSWRSRVSLKQVEEEGEE